MKKSIACSISAILTFALSSFCSSLHAADPKSPNILVIVADDLGWAELGCQGNPQIPTPHIDSLAANGIRFTSGYVSGPYCSPTRAALLTGKYQQRFGHEFNPGGQPAGSKVFGLPLGEETLPERLRQAGYATGMFGKWHLGSEPEFHPLKRGFDEFFGFLGGAHSYLRSGRGKAAILRGTEPTEIDFTTEAFARETVAFIERHREKPWFVYLPFNAVHGPLEAPDKYLERFASIEDSKRRTFAGMLSALDDAVGVVLAKLRELDAEKETLIFFFSDNGGPTASITSSNQPLRGFKAQTWEGGVRVPFIVQWKDHLPAGKIDDRPVIQMDVHATALAAAGVESKPEWKLDGVNLLPFLTGENTAAPHEALFWRFGSQMAVRAGEWKLIKAPGSPLGGGKKRAGGGQTMASAEGAELYHLSSDIGEKSDLAAKEPDKAKELAALWTRWNSELAEPAWYPGPRKGKGAGKKKRAE